MLIVSGCSTGRISGAGLIEQEPLRVFATAHFHLAAARSGPQRFIGRARPEQRRTEHAACRFLKNFSAKVPEAVPARSLLAATMLYETHPNRRIFYLERGSEDQPLGSTAKSRGRAMAAKRKIKDF
jgi:hypothetical protein